MDVFGNILIGRYIPSVPAPFLHAFPISYPIPEAMPRSFAARGRSTRPDLEFESGVNDDALGGDKDRGIGRLKLSTLRRYVLSLQDIGEKPTKAIA